MIADIFVTYKDRKNLFTRSINSLLDCTPRDHFRLTIVCDGFDVPEIATKHADYILVNRENMGLGPSINHAVAHIDMLNRWYESSVKLSDRTLETQFIAYCQDDLLYTEGWLEKLLKFFMLYEKTYNLGFASGVECVEHPVRDELPGGAVLKDWIRAANMVARREYWTSMVPISAFDPETGQKRAKPNDGIGSGVDWWFIRNHENSVCKTGRTNLVIPGLLQHAGYDQSTWLDRELPESEDDKEIVDAS